MTERSIITFSSIDWDAVWQGHQEVMSRLAAKGHPILFVENTGIRRPRLADVPRLWRRAKHVAGITPPARDPAHGIQVHAPRIVPFPYWPPAVSLNRRILEGPLQHWSRRQPAPPFVWTYLPTPLVRALVRTLVPALLIYYCVDDLPASSELARPLAESEAEMFRTADLVFVTSEALRRKALRHRPDVHVFPSGVSYQRFAAARTNPEPMPEEMRRLPRPVVGYVGGPHRWFDSALTLEVARLLPNVQFAFIGPIQAAAASHASPQNVHWLGAKPAEAVPAYLRHLDAAIIPYVLDDYTNSVFPTKLNEYLAMGLPVVSTPLPEVLAFRDRFGDVVEIAATASAFAAALSRLLSEPQSSAAREARHEVARNQDWDLRVDGMRALMASALQAKQTRGGE